MTRPLSFLPTSCFCMLFCGLGCLYLTSTRSPISKLKSRLASVLTGFIAGSLRRRGEFDPNDMMSSIKDMIFIKLKSSKYKLMTWRNRCLSIKGNTKTYRCQRVHQRWNQWYLRRQGHGRHRLMVCNGASSMPLP